MTKPKTVAAKKAATPKQPKTSKSPSKLSQLEAMLRRPTGATIPQLVKALSWLARRPLRSRIESWVAMGAGRHCGQDQAQEYP